MFGFLLRGSLPLLRWVSAAIRNCQILDDRRLLLAKDGRISGATLRAQLWMRGWNWGRYAEALRVAEPGWQHACYGLG